jgi:hypothetical protein
MIYSEFAFFKWSKKINQYNLKHIAIHKVIRFKTFFQFQIAPLTNNPPLKTGIIKIQNLVCFLV